ncbi:hypothetical protein B7494_g4756 [Chlorociboria aeruginascens]|nr:hypothetical protein B7494_g4756 [Chlorociboria aeruginascens]
MPGSSQPSEALSSQALDFPTFRLSFRQRIMLAMHTYTVLMADCCVSWPIRSRLDTNFDPRMASIEPRSSKRILVAAESSDKNVSKLMSSIHARDTGRPFSRVGAGLNGGSGNALSGDVSDGWFLVVLSPAVPLGPRALSSDCHPRAFAFVPSPISSTISTQQLVSS